MRYIDSAQIRARLTLDAAYASQVTAFTCLADGVADLPGRLILDGTARTDGASGTGAGGTDAVGFCYAARLRPGTGPVAKFGAVAAGNAALGLPSVHAVVIALHPTTGQPLALLDGEALTELRTAAATAVAVDRLAAPDRSTLAVLGCGVQGRAHLRALTARHRYRRVVVWDHTPAHTAALTGAALTGAAATGAAATGAAVAGVAVAEVTVADSAEAAVRAADVVVLCTTSAEPVIDGAWVAPGTLVASIGSFESGRCEVAPAFVARADLVVVDHAPIALHQAGPVVRAVAGHGLRPSTVVSLGDVLTGRHPGRGPGAPTVYYNSVGLGVQDAAAVWAVLDRSDG